MTLILTAAVALAIGAALGALVMAARRSDADAERRLGDELPLYGDLASYGGTDCDDDDPTERTA